MIMYQNIKECEKLLSPNVTLRLTSLKILRTTRIFPRSFTVFNHL